MQWREVALLTGSAALAVGVARLLTVVGSRRFLSLLAAAPAAAAKPVVVGLTGSIGMGKSTASSWFRRAGYRVHDADACVHTLYAAGGAAVPAVCAAFPGVEAENGGIDRAKLGAAVAQAGREASLKKLETIVHPLVTADRNAFLEKASKDGEWLVVLDVPLLLETMDEAARAKLLDALVVVSAPAELQRERVLARPGMTAERRVHAASPRADVHTRATRAAHQNRPPRSPTHASAFPPHGCSQPLSLHAADAARRAVLVAVLSARQARLHLEQAGLRRHQACRRRLRHRHHRRRALSRAPCRMPA
jgi:dephospho-CoA kinase